MKWTMMEFVSVRWENYDVFRTLSSFVINSASIFFLRSVKKTCSILYDRFVFGISQKVKWTFHLQVKTLIRSFQEWVLVLQSNVVPISQFQLWVYCRRHLLLEDYSHWTKLRLMQGLGLFLLVLTFSEPLKQHDTNQQIYWSSKCHFW